MVIYSSDVPIHDTRGQGAAGLRFVGEGPLRTAAKPLLITFSSSSAKQRRENASLKFDRPMAHRPVANVVRTNPNPPHPALILL